MKPLAFATLWDFNRLWLGSHWKKGYLRDEAQIAVRRSIHEAKNNDGLMVTRNRRLFNVPSRESPLSLPLDTRSVCRASGFVQIPIALKIPRPPVNK